MQGAAVTKPAQECDVAIIGGGGDGLTAAALLARKGLRVVVIERNARPGGRLTTREFHPGFRASPFQDEVAPVPVDLHWKLDLGRRGVLFLPTRVSTAAWPGRQHIVEAGGDAGMLAVRDRIANEVLRWAEGPSSQNFVDRLMGGREAALPANDLSFQSLANVLGNAGRDSDSLAHKIAFATAGRASDPLLVGTALHLLAPGVGTSGTVPGGTGRLGEALVDAAIAAGAEIICGSAVTEIRSSGGRVRALGMADGTSIRARTVISTLDVKRTFLSLFKWDELPKAVSVRAQNFRMAGGTARILLALSRTPQLVNRTRDPLQGLIFVAPQLDEFRKAYAAWRSQLIPDVPPIAVCIVSATDPSLAPLGAATMTVTVGCIPYRRMDRAWCFWKRDELRVRVLAQLEPLFPGITQSVLGWEVLAPPDIEDQLGASEGDLSGGEMAPDQMFDLRPGFSTAPPRTFLRGLYLAGKSTPAGPLFTGAAGAIAARAVLSDLGRR